MKDFYDTTKKLAGKYTRTNSQEKDKEGTGLGHIIKLPKKGNMRECKNYFV